MRALLDVNVLIALFDADHVSHHAATQWFASYAPNGWASCPITQNGCVRILSHPGYPSSHRVLDVIQRLRDATSHPLHEFWPDDVSVLDPAVMDATRIHGPRQITDAYLLALAVRRGGVFVTFDRSLVRSAVRGVQPSSVLVL